MSTDTAEGTAEVRVSGKTATRDLAQSIASHIRDGKTVVLVAIGHNAIGQAVKAVPVVNGFLAPRGIVFSILPVFEEREIEDDGVVVTRTAMLMKLVRYSFR